MKLKIRQIIYILLAIAAFSLLIAVVTNSQSPESLMAPPEAAGDYKEIQDVIKNSVDSGIILKAPNEGDYTTAITFVDINLDGENDAIAFYRLANDDTSSIYMSVLIKKDSKWIASESVKGKGNDILEFSYGDLNYDSVPEIIVGWSMFDSKDNNSLCVYSVDTKKENNPVNLDDYLIYTKMFVDDICLEGKKEILVVKNTYNDENAEAKATVYELVDSKLNVISSADMLSSVSEYRKIQTQTISSKKVFFLDGVVGKNKMITELLYWSEDSLSLINATAQNDEKSTLRKGNLTSFDINSDSIAEIPFNDVNSDEELPITYWKDFYFDGFRTIAQSVCTDELIFVFPEKWNDRIYANQNGNVISFYSLNDDEKFFELVSCDISSWEQYEKEYEQLKIDYGTIYGVKFAQSKSDINLTKNEIKQAIINIR